MEVRLPVRSAVRDRILRMEWDKHVKDSQKKFVTLDEHYSQMGEMGKMFTEIFNRENRARVKAAENPDIIKFIKDFIRIAKKRAEEMGYDYKDIQVSTDSGINENGTMEFRFEPKPGAQPHGRAS